MNDSGCEPDLSGLVPVRSLAELKAQARQSAHAPLSTGLSSRPVRRAAEHDDAHADPSAPTVAKAPGPSLDPLTALRRGWGYDAFRPLQADAVDAGLTGRDCLVVLPTGGGKSLCYQVPALCGARLVLVVSPLIALMDDQVAGAREAGIAAGALHANLVDSERRMVRSALDAGSLDLLYVSPERLVAGDLLPSLTGRVRLLAVDEAHCVSHWGHDFRPEYRQLSGIFDRLSGSGPRPARMGLTATATPQVQDDIAVQLGLRNPTRLIGHVDRANLCYRVLPRGSAAEQIFAIIARHPQEGGIVYAQTRKEVEHIAQELTERGIDARAYHAGLDPVLRRRTQDDFVNERLTVVVATIAFGMGIDRSNVRFVIHANCPRSIEHYQQEAGRAGRDGDPAECVLLWNGSDFATWRFLATRDGALPPDREQSMERQLRSIGRYCVAPLCRHRLLTEHFSQPYPAPAPAPTAERSVGETAGCGACDVCLGETTALEPAAALVAAQKILSAVWRTGGRFGAVHICDLVRGRATDRLTSRGHHGLSVFGLLREIPEGTVRTWIDQLVVQGHLSLDDGEYPTLSLSETGRALCKGLGEVRLSQPVARPERPSRKQRSAASTPAPPPLGSNAALFERLRLLRRLIAARAGVPPYIVCTDTTLHALAAAKPIDRTGLIAIKGIGERKADRYGAALLAVIAGADPETVR